MIKVLKEPRQDTILYTCRQGDTLESIARKFGTSTANILENNPLFSGVYEGCMLLLSNISKRRITVEPLETLESIANRYNTTQDKLIKLNNLKSNKIFVGMQLLVDEFNEE